MGVRLLYCLSSIGECWTEFEVGGKESVYWTYTVGLRRIRLFAHAICPFGMAQDIAN